MFNSYVRVCVGKLTSYVQVGVYHDIFNCNDCDVIEEMMMWKDMTESKTFRVECVANEYGYVVYDDNNNKLEFDY